VNSAFLYTFETIVNIKRILSVLVVGSYLGEYCTVVGSYLEEYCRKTINTLGNTVE
jgi:hypothetical protein